MAVSEGHGRLEFMGLRPSSVRTQYRAGLGAPSPFPHIDQVFRVHREVFSLHGTPVSEETAYGSRPCLRSKQSEPG